MALLSGSTLTCLAGAVPHNTAFFPAFRASFMQGNILLDIASVAVRSRAHYELPWMEECLTKDLAVQRG